MPIFSAHQTSIPRDCPFHPERDYLWWPPESSVVEEDSDSSQSDYYRCPVCLQQLYTAQALVEHWDELHRHAERDAVSIIIFYFFNLLVLEWPNH